MITRIWAELIETASDLAFVPPAMRNDARILELVAGQRIARLGERPQWIFYVVVGEVRLLRHARNGARILLQRARSGFVAEASLESARYHCDIEAGRASVVIAFPRERFRRTLRADAAFRDFWMSRLVDEIRTLRAKCERLSLRAATDRIEHYIESEGRDGVLELPQSKKDWAAELGLTHEALYRALAGMGRAGRLTTRASEDRVRLRLLKPRD
jgi:CRP-like cAMP-binding protein